MANDVFKKIDTVKKKDVDKKNKKFKSVKGYNITIGFSNRTVTCPPFGTIELTFEEYDSVQFNRVKNEFVEVK